MRTKTTYVNTLNGLANETAVLIQPLREIPISQRRAIIALHGHGATSTVWTPGWAGARHCQILADAGYYVLSIDAGGPATFNNKAAMDAITNAYAYLMGTVGLAETKVGLFGWSMGGGNALQWIKENPTKVWAALLWAPLTDLDYHAGSSNPAPGTEAYAAYGIPIYPTNDYPLNSTGHKIADEYPTWRNKCPIRIIQGLADTTVPPSKTTAFINGVNAAPGSPAPNIVEQVQLAGSDHTSLFVGYPISDTLEFFRDNQNDLGVYVPNPLKLLAPESDKYQDSARTTLAVNNGDPVGSWTDILGAQHMVQATAGKRPLLKKNILNGYDVLEWDGVDDYMEATMTAKTSYTIFLVAKKMNVTRGRTLMGFKISSSRVVLFDSATAGYAFFLTEGGTTQELGGPTPDQWNIICFRTVSSSLVEYRVGGGAPTVTFDPNDIATTANVLMLGANNNVAGSFGAYQVAELRRYDGALTLDQIQSIGAGLGSKFGLGWATALA